MADISADTFPKHLVPQLMETLSVFSNETTDFSQPHVKQSFEHTYAVFVTLYVFVAIVGSIANSAMIVKLFYIESYFRSVSCGGSEHLFLINVALLNVLLSLLVMPISLFILLIQNWTLGKVVCYLAPIMQVRYLIITCMFALMHELACILPASNTNGILYCTALPG